MPTYLIIVILIGVFLLIVIALFAQFIPNKWRIEETVLVSALPEMLFPLINRPSNWQKWSTWSKDFDESIELEFGQEKEGIGAVQAWRSRQMNGIFTIVQSIEDSSIQFHLSLDDNRHILHAQILLSPIGDQTSVIWITKYEEDGFHPLKRLQSSTLRKLIQFNMQASLENLQHRYGNE